MTSFRCPRMPLFRSLFAFAFGFLAGLSMLAQVRAEETPTGGLSQGNASVAVFQKNLGQWDDRVAFRGRFGAVTVSFLSNGLSYCVVREEEEEEETEELRTDVPKGPLHEEEYELLVWTSLFEDMNPQARLSASGMENSHCHYFLGNDPSRWAADVPAFTELMYEEVYEHIDLRYYAADGALKYDYIIRPGGDISRIKTSWQGVKELRLNAAGQLEIETAWGTEVEARPFSYQMNGGVMTEVNVAFRPESGNRVGFAITGPYDPSLPLIIDPVTLRWGTYLNATGANPYCYANALDANKNIYTTGYCVSTFPVTAGVFQGSYGGGTTDTYVLKFNRTGTALVYSTFIGGSSTDEGNALEVDASGNVYLAGTTSSANFPVLGAYQAANGGGSDVFVLKLNPTGSGILYSTYIGGTSTDYGRSIAISATGEAYLTGETFSNNYDVTAGAYQTVASTSPDSYITKLNAAGNGLVYSSYLAGNSNDYARVVKVNAAGNAFVAGYTFSNNYPTTAGVTQTVHAGGVYDIFVTQMNVAGNGLVYSTFVGGTGIDVLGEQGGGRAGNQMALNSSNEVFVTGFSSSTNFPTTAGALQTTLGGSDDAFVFKLNATATTKVYSTYFGGAGGAEHPMSISVNSAGQAYVAGYTTATGLPLTAGNFQAAFGGGGYDMFLFHLNATGTALACGGSTYIGGNSSDYFNPSVIWDGSGVVDTLVISGTTHSANFPAITAGTYQTTYINGFDDEPVTFKMYSCTTVLPLQDLSLRAQVAGAAVQLEWTAAEVNGTDRFVIERSRDGQGFTQVHEMVAGAPGQNAYYSFVDFSPASFPQYYRVQQVESNGSMRFSNVAIVVQPGSTDWIRAYPNPAQDVLQVEWNVSQPTPIQIVDVLGRVLIEQEAAAAQAQQKVDIRPLAPGLYWVRAAGLQARFVKE